MAYVYVYDQMTGVWSSLNEHFRGDYFTYFNAISSERMSILNFLSNVEYSGDI